MRLAEAYERVRDEGRESAAWPEFYRILNAMTRRQYGYRNGECEDVCQEVWLRILRRGLIQQFRGKENQVSNYFWQVIRTVLLDVAKHNRAQCRSVPVVSYYEGDSSQPFDEYRAGHMLEHIDWLFQFLSFREQICLRLMALGHNQKYIAECIGTSPNGIGSLKTRVRRKLKAMVER